MHATAGRSSGTNQIQQRDLVDGATAADMPVGQLYQLGSPLNSATGANGQTTFTATTFFLSFCEAPFEAFPRPVSGCKVMIGPRRTTPG